VDIPALARPTGALHTRVMTMPDQDDAGSDRKARPLGAEVAPPGDRTSQGGEPGPASGIAGPSYPPADTEPDAH
jgi:hypothetical protein